MKVLGSEFDIVGCSLLNAEEVCSFEVEALGWNVVMLFVVAAGELEGDVASFLLLSELSFRPRAFIGMLKVKQALV